MSGQPDSGLGSSVEEERMLSRWPAPLGNVNDAESPEEAWEFWKPLVTNDDGSLNVEAVRNELSDFSMLMRYYSAVLCEVTGHRISKTNTHPSVVASVVSDYIQDCVADGVRDECEDLIAALKAAESYLAARVTGTGGVGETEVLPKIRAALSLCGESHP